MSAAVSVEHPVTSGLCLFNLKYCFIILKILTWEHYLPRVLGESTMSGLMPPYQGYDPNVNPSIANVFATAAFRFAHVTVQPVVTRLGPRYTFNSKYPPLPLHHSLFASWRVVQEGNPELTPTFLDLV